MRTTATTTTTVTTTTTATMTTTTIATTTTTAITTTTATTVITAKVPGDKKKNGTQTNRHKTVKNGHKRVILVSTIT